MGSTMLEGNNRPGPGWGLLLPGVLGLLLAGCAGAPEGSHGTPHGGPVTCAKKFAGQPPLRAVCTTGMVADLVERIGGDRVRVTTLMGEGIDPHQYKASPGDVAALSDADVIFYSGLHLEGKMGDLFARLTRTKATFAVAEYLEPNRVLQAGGAYDPHVWFDVGLWREVAGVVGDALAAFDPAGAQGYQERARDYQAELERLNDWVVRELGSIPKERRVLVTAHDAFRYFGHAYDVEVRGIQGISTESEAGVKEVNNLVDFLVSSKVKAIFVESSVSERNVRALVEGCKARGHDVVVGGELFSDAMGKKGTPEGTYTGMVRHNVETIVQALR